MIPALLVMAALLLLALAAVVLPLCFPNKRPVIEERESNLAVWRAERAALARELAQGELSSSEHEEALLDLRRRAAGEVLDNGSEPAKARSGARRGLALALATLVIASSVLLYGLFGNEAALDSSGPISPRVDPRVIAMVDRLAEKMRTNPNDVQGWKLLGHSQLVLGRYSDAAGSYARANALAPRDAQVLADYADALAMASGETLEGRPRELLQRALEIDPDNLKALELAGSAELARKNFAGALGYWERLERLLPPGSEDAQQIEQTLVALRQRVGARQSGPPGATAGAQDSSRATPGVAGKVDIAPNLASRVALTDTVFVFARATNPAAGAPHMPLAVLRFGARELPRAFELTDAMAMAPGAKLSSASSVIVEARVSKSGNALAASGDLRGASAPVKPGTRGVQIVIDSVVP